MKRYLLQFTFLLLVSSYFSGMLRLFFIENPNSQFVFISKLINILWHSFVPLLALYLALLIYWIIKLKSSILFVGIGSVFTLIVSLYLLKLESINYNNYLYSSFGLTKINTEFLLNISLITIIVFVALLINFKDKKDLNINTKNVGAYVSIGILVWLSIQSFLKMGESLSYLKFTYHKQFENYNEILALKKVVPENKMILMPEQSSIFPAISNLPVARYFLGPRVLISSTYLANLETLDGLSEMYFVKLKKDKTEWPEIFLDKNEIKIANNKAIKFKKLEIVKSDSQFEIYKITL